MNASELFSVIFGLALALSLALKFGLAWRQIAAVMSHRGAVPIAFAAQVSLTAHQKAADYTVAKQRLGLLELALGALVLLGWTLFGGLNALNQLLLAWVGPGMVQQIALVVAVVFIGGLIDLPLSLYQTFGLEQRFGFNKMTVRLWLQDAFKGVLLGAMLGLPLLALVLWLMGVAGALWWLYAWAALVAFNLFVLWIAPTVIMPLFNKFTPLEDAVLRARAQALMARAGFAARGFFVMDGSRRSAHSNAFFTGLGRAKRVVFFDTLLEKLNHDEMEAVLAHELGHFKHRHIVKRIALSLLSSLAALALLGWLAQQTWFYTGLGVAPHVGGPNDALLLLLFMMVAPVFSFFASPLWAYWSRKHEFEADAYAVAQANGGALASALLKLYESNAATLTPDPWYMRFYASHPGATERLGRLGAVGNGVAA